MKRAKTLKAEEQKLVLTYIAVRRHAGHASISLRNIARTVLLNGIQNAMLNACLNADGLEAMPPRVAFDAYRPALRLS